MIYAMPGSKDALYTFKGRYENFIGGEWVAANATKTLDVVSPETEKTICQVAIGTAGDLDRAVLAARIIQAAP